VGGEGWKGSVNGWLGERIESHPVQVLKYFPSKEALVEGLIDQVAAGVQPALNVDALPLRVALTQIGRATLDAVVSEPAAAALRLCLGAYGRFPQLARTVWTHGPEVTYAGFARFIEQRCTTGELEVDDVQLRIMDRRGRRVVIRTGAVFALAATAGYLTVDRIGPWLYMVRVLDGLGAAFLYASLFTYAAELAPIARRTQGIALFGASGLASMAISSLLGDAILATGSYRQMFAVSLAFCTLGGALCFGLPESGKPTHGQAPAQSLLHTARQRDLLPIWFAALSFFSCMAGLLGFMRTFVLATGFGSVGAFFSAYVGVALLLRVLLGSLPDRIGLRRMVLPALGSYGLGIIAIAHASGSGSLLLAGALCGVGHGYGFPVLFSLLVSRAHPSTRGAAAGIYTTVDWTGHLFAPPLFGLWIERAGYPVAFTGLGAFALLGVAGFFLLDPRAQTAES